MNKLHYIKDGTNNEYTKLSFSKDECDISDNSDKEIMVINRMLKSKIFLNPSNNDMNKKIIKKSTKIYNSIEQFDRNKLKKTFNVQCKNEKNKLNRYPTCIKNKQNSSKEMEKTNIKKSTENNKKINEIERNNELDKNQNKRKGNEKEENEKSDKLDTFSEQASKNEISNNCMIHKNTKSNIDNIFSYKMEGKTDDQQSNGNNNEREINRKLYEINKKNNFNYSYSCNIIKKGLGYNHKELAEENYVIIYSDKNIKENNNYCIEENIKEIDFPMNNNYLCESNKGTCLQKDEHILINKDNSPIIKYDEFELEEINKELEKIIEEENNIQEEIIHLTDKELEIAIKIKKMQHHKNLIEKENKKREYEECIKE